MYPSDDLLLSLEPPSFDLGIEFTPPNVLHSEETQKRVDSIISDVVTATKTVENEVFTCFSSCRSQITHTSKPCYIIRS